MSKEIEFTPEQLAIQKEAVYLDQLEKEVEVKRLELKEKFKREVYSYIVKIKDGDYAISFIQEPQRLTKMRAMDSMNTNGSISSVGDMVLQSSLIKEESDRRVLDLNPEYDSLYLTMINACSELISMYSTVLKKK